MRKASDDATALLAAFLVLGMEVENGPDTTKSMAVGRSGVSPGADKAGKIRASAGQEAVDAHRAGREVDSSAEGGEKCQLGAKASKLAPQE